MVDVEFSRDCDLSAVVVAEPLAFSGPSASHQGINQGLGGEYFLSGVKAVTIRIDPVFPVSSVVPFLLLRGDCDSDEEFGQSDPTLGGRCGRG